MPELSVVQYKSSSSISHYFFSKESFVVDRYLLWCFRLSFSLSLLPTCSIVHSDFYDHISYKNSIYRQSADSHEHISDNENGICVVCTLIILLTTNFDSKISTSLNQKFPKYAFVHMILVINTLSLQLPR